jgi:hypothetical protein
MFSLLFQSNVWKSRPATVCRAGFSTLEAEKDSESRAGGRHRPAGLPARLAAKSGHATRRYFEHGWAAAQEGTKCCDARDENV